MATWAESAIWWHIYPIGFLGAEKNALAASSAVIPRLTGLEPWLQYLLELGCNGLLLAPIFASSTHGYDTIDHFNIDHRLGTNDDFLWLAERCKTLGIKLVLDGVFNHVGRQFGPFQDVLAHKQHSQYASWFHIDWHNNQNEDGFSYKNFEGHRQLVTINHYNQAVVRYVVDVLKHWLRLGANGWRLDAAYALPQQFLSDVIPQVKEEFPEAWFLAEVIHGDYANMAKQTHVDSVTQYELWKAIWSSLNDHNFFELKHALDRHNQFSATFMPNVFLGNHDVTRIATQLKDSRHLDLAMTLLLTLPGIPSIYAGDEQGFTGRKENRPGGDDEIRPAFPSDPSGFAQDGWTRFAKYQAMVRFRKNHAWIAGAHVSIQTFNNTFLVYRVEKEGRNITVILNCGDNSVRVDTSGFGNRTIGSKLDDSMLEPHGAVVLY